MMEYSGVNPKNLDSLSSEKSSKAINTLYDNRNAIINDVKSDIGDGIDDKKNEIANQISDAIEQAKNDFIENIKNSNIVKMANEAIEELDNVLMTQYHHPYEGGINYLLNNPASASRFIIGTAGMLLGSGIQTVPEIFKEYGRWLGLTHYEHGYEGSFNENRLTYEKNGNTYFYKDPTGLQVTEANPGSALEFITDENIKQYLGEKYNANITRKMNRIEKFDTTSKKVENPKVSEIGIKKALIIWRSRSVLEVDATKLIFYITTPKKDYAFTIQRDNDNIYCCASYDEPFDLGLRGGKQNFRIRNYNGNIENVFNSLTGTNFNFVFKLENLHDF